MTKENVVKGINNTTSKLYKSMMKAREETRYKERLIEKRDY